MYLYFNNIGIPLFFIGVVLLIIILIRLWKQKDNHSYLFFFSLFWIYLMLGIDKVFFPLEINGIYVDEMRQVPILAFINLKPFFLSIDNVTVAMTRQLINNVILTIPFGFGLNFLTPVKTRKVVVISIALGIGVEVMQLFLSLILGYPYRVIDIDDALCNMVGVLLGYGLFKLFAYLYLAMMRDSEDAKSGLALYLDNVVHQRDQSYKDISDL